MAPDMKKFTVRLPPELIEKVNAAADAEGMTTADFVRRALEDAIVAPTRGELIRREELDAVITRAIQLHLTIDHGLKAMDEETLRRVLEALGRGGEKG